MRTLAPFAGLLGGLAWLAALMLARADRTALAAVVEWAGLLLLLTATIAAGAALVSRSTTWLRVVVGVCFALLLGSLVQLAEDGADDRLVHAFAGLLAVVVASAIMARRPDPAVQPASHRARNDRARATRGAHAR